MTTFSSSFFFCHHHIFILFNKLCHDHTIFHFPFYMSRPYFPFFFLSFLLLRHFNFANLIGYCMGCLRRVDYCIQISLRSCVTDIIIVDNQCLCDQGNHQRYTIKRTEDIFFNYYLTFPKQNDVHNNFHSMFAFDISFLCFQHLNTKIAELPKI